MNSAFELYRNLDAGQMDRDNRIATAMLAMEMGLDPVEFSKPFPGNRTMTVHNHAPQPAPRKGLSPLAAVALGLLTASVPAAGAIGYLLNEKPTIPQAIEKIVEKPIEKVITKPGKDFDVSVDMEVIPPP